MNRTASAKVELSPLDEYEELKVQKTRDDCWAENARNDCTGNKGTDEPPEASNGRRRWVELSVRRLERTEDCRELYWQVPIIFKLPSIN